MISEAEKGILKALDDRELAKDGLPPILALYRQLVRIQSGARSRIALPDFNSGKESVSNKLREGTPLLEFKDIPIDWTLYLDLFNQIASVFASYPDFCCDVPGHLNDKIAFKSLVERWYRGYPSDNQMEDSPILKMMLQAALKPFLSVSSEVLLKGINQEQWLRGYCPLCGGLPDFAFLDKECGARYLVCSRCDSDWLFKRMECQNCANQDQNTLAYFTNDSGLYRLYVCEKCRKYLKAIDLRCTEDQVLLPLERFITLDLDRQACANGYSAMVNS